MQFIRQQLQPTRELVPDHLPVLTERNPATCHQLALLTTFLPESKVLMLPLPSVLPTGVAPPPHCVGFMMYLHFFFPFSLLLPFLTSSSTNQQTYAPPAQKKLHLTWVQLSWHLPIYCPVSFHTCTSGLPRQAMRPWKLSLVTIIGGKFFFFFCYDH